MHGLRFLAQTARERIFGARVAERRSNKLHRRRRFLAMFLAPHFLTISLSAMTSRRWRYRSPMVAPLHHCTIALSHHRTIAPWHHGTIAEATSRNGHQHRIAFGWLHRSTTDGPSTNIKRRVGIFRLIWDGVLFEKFTLKMTIRGTEKDQKRIRRGSEEDQKRIMPCRGGDYAIHTSLLTKTNTSMKVLDHSSPLSHHSSLSVPYR